MKKILGAVALLGVLVALCWYCTWRVDQVCGQTAGYLLRAEQRCGEEDYPGAREAVEQSWAYWQAHENLLGLALRHTESENVDMGYPGLLEACRQEDGEEFLLRSRELGAVIRQLSHMEKPYWFNIM